MKRWPTRWWHHRTSPTTAQAIEALGMAPKLVPGSAGNIKITHADDARAGRVLSFASCCGMTLVVVISC